MKINVTIFNKIKTGFKNKQAVVLLTGLLFFLCSQQSQAQSGVAKSNIKELTDSATVLSDSLAALNNPAAINKPASSDCEKTFFHIKISLYGFI